VGERLKERETAWESRVGPSEAIRLKKGSDRGVADVGRASKMTCSGDGPGECGCAYLK
jgi:hypothetical protein